MKREDCFYWVKYCGEWQVASWINYTSFKPCWFICGDEVELCYDEFEYIWKQIEKPED